MAGGRAQKPLDGFYRIQQVEDLGAGPPLQISVPTAREDRLSGLFVCPYTWCPLIAPVGSPAGVKLDLRPTQADYAEPSLVPEPLRSLRPDYFQP